MNQKHCRETRQTLQSVEFYNGPRENFQYAKYHLYSKSNGKT